MNLLREFIKECKSNPIEVLQDSVMLFLIFAFGYFLLMLGAILGLN